MKKKWCFVCITLTASLMTSCASQFPFIAPQVCAEATALKNVCSNLRVDATEQMVTDSLYNQGANLIRTGRNEKAHELLSRAIIRYRLILLRYTIAGKESEIERLKHELANDMDELSTCQRIIDELTTVEQP